MNNAGFMVGDKVRIIVSHPQYSWGATVTKDSVGTLTQINRSGDVYINFPNHGDWQGRLSELGHVEEDITSVNMVDE